MVDRFRLATARRVAFPAKRIAAQFFWAISAVLKMPQLHWAWVIVVPGMKGRAKLDFILSSKLIRWGSVNNLEP